MSRSRWSGLAGLAALLSIGMLALWFSHGTWPGRAGSDRRLGAAYFPDVVLTTEDGKDVRFYSDLIKGKTVAINFIYSHCGFSCPLETARLAQVQRLLGDRLGRDIFFYSISIDPAHDTPAVLKEYADKFDAGPGWLFLTGKPTDIDLLAVKLGLTEDDHITDAIGEDIDGHAPHLLVGNEATGQWMRDSATDNPRFLADLIGNLVDNGAHGPHPAEDGSAGAPIAMSSAGQYLFTKECAPCHTIGHGDKIGPDLADVMRRREAAWVARFITEPDKVLAEGDPIAVALKAQYAATMPDLRVGDRDLAAIMEFLSAQVPDRSAAGQHAAAVPGGDRVR
jgi:protein SCO1/2